MTRKALRGYTVLEIATGAIVLPEKQVEALGDRIMQAAGFQVVRFSQPRATMQTAGIPDRRYYRVGPNAANSLSVWWEAKREGGKQSRAQASFQRMVEACGEVYLLGTDDVLIEYLRLRGLIE